MDSTVHEEIDQWLKSVPAGAVVRAYAWSPNGGDGGPTGEWAWISQEQVAELIARRDWTSAEYFGGPWPSLSLLYIPGDSAEHGGSSQYCELYYCPPPRGKRQRIARLDRSGNFEWDQEFSASPSRLFRAILETIGTSQSEISFLGLTSTEDCAGQEGEISWVVSNPGLFVTVLFACHMLDYLVDPVKCDPRDIYQALKRSSRLAGLQG